MRSCFFVLCFILLQTRLTRSQFEERRPKDLRDELSTLETLKKPNKNVATSFAIALIDLLAIILNRTAHRSENLA